ncbi:phosphotransferase family protein [Nocardia sp. alder85J]|uniref:phosphotransferase family protein n=1 Tax=Nocardia sp. alder85J TaxID=2862949 RepID=UPI001CD4A799|nr:aminoglycoside phosphotransferase family protein [Nocardia sp. alder85J]MCX4098033.1 aminoglycoside phosphotransferase family protein [Nocardia sp. alder85J]
MAQPGRSDSALPGPDALEAACRRFGVNGQGARQLHNRSNAVYLLPNERSGGIIVRLAPDTELRRQRADTAVAVTRWLGTHSAEPIGLQPLTGDQPVIAAGAVTTFWPYCLTEIPATLTDVAILLHRLHQTSRPSFTVPEYRPLHRLREALDLEDMREQPALSADNRHWIRKRATELVDAYHATEFPLGVGLVHADAHTENAVRDEHGYVLIDWDQCCIGPRALDLISGLPDHFHRPESERRQFLDAYGYDLLSWPGWQLLRDIGELHSIASYIRLAPHKPTAAAQLEVRVRSLRDEDRAVEWQAIA